MLLAKKFSIVLLGSIWFIAIINIIGFYFFYSSYLKIFLAWKYQNKTSVSLDYINNLVLKSELEKQENEIDDLLNSVQIEFFEKLGDDNIIHLNSKENLDLVINYLSKSGVASKYMEEFVPRNNLQKVLESLKDRDSGEYKFIRSIFGSIIITNAVAIIIIILLMMLFTRRTLHPIKQATRKIKNLKPWKDSMFIEYNAKDEVGLLVNSINGLNKRLTLQESIKSKLLADISHELKTPITSIQCYLEWISDGVISLNEKNLNSITSEMQRLIELVNRIMKYEQFENTSLEIDLKNKNVGNILKEIVETHKKKLKETHQRIKISWDENLKIFLDKDLFKQLAHNLIWNFLKYAGKWSLLTINITKKYIDFSDNGKWINKSEIPFLTEKFYQGDVSKSAHVNERGIGVWLSIVGKIIAAHEWSLKIRSDKKSGFSFKIYL